MRPAKTIFAVPTYRLRDVAETVETYDEHFWSNGHSVKMMVFDDSSLANHQKYFSQLEQTKTVNDLYYVGPHEKEQFIGFLNRKLRDRKLESLVRNLFRPSYGGNRNFTLMYKITAVHSRVLSSAAATRDPQRREALTLFAENLARSFYGFELDFFQQNVTRIVDDVVSVIQASLELWPTLVEVCYFHKDKRDFPQLQVKNKKLKTRNGGPSRSG